MTEPNIALRRTPFLEINGAPIYFTDDWETGIGGGLWSTGLAMAKYFQSHSNQVRQSMQRLAATSNSAGRKLTVLELGSGNGFLSVCLMAVARDLVGQLVITDTEDHLSLMKNTVQANDHIMDNASCQVVVAEHKWGEFDNVNVETASVVVVNGSHQYDVIFGSDLAYREELYEPLICSLKRLCHASTIFLLGVTMKDTTPKFFHLLRDAGFWYTRFPDHVMEPEFRGTTFGIFVIQKRKV